VQTNKLPENWEKDYEYTRPEDQEIENTDEYIIYPDFVDDRELKVLYEQRDRKIAEEAAAAARANKTL